MDCGEGVKAHAGDKRKACGDVGDSTKFSGEKGSTASGICNDESVMTTNRKTLLKVAADPLETSHQPIILKGKEGLLSDLLSPLDSEDFMKNYFRKTAVYVASQSGAERAEEVAERLFNLDPEGILRETASDNIFCWLKNQKGRLASVRVEADAAIALHAAGHATYCRAPPELEQLLVGTLLRDTGYGCGQYDPSGESVKSMGRGEVEILMGTANHVTGWHTDFQENFTIQLSGSKRWRLRRGTVSHTLRGITPHYQDPGSVEPQLLAGRLADPSLQFGTPTQGVNASGPVETVVLEPGDALYFPAGMWHEVETVEAGVSLNISLMARTYANLVTESLEHVLLQHETWRERVTRPAEGRSGVVRKLETLLAALPGIIQDFSRQGGAQAMLPPCLCQSKGDNNDDYNEVSIEDNEDHDGTELDEPVLLEPPYGVPVSHAISAGECKRLFQSSYIVKSPLAALILQDDVTRYYYSNEPEDDDDSVVSGREILVVNVNFAGNDAHEPSVRRVFRISNQGTLVPQLLSNATEISARDVDFDADLNIMSALVYYGCLVWVRKSE